MNDDTDRKKLIKNYGILFEALYEIKSRGDFYEASVARKAIKRVSDSGYAYDVSTGTIREKTD